MSARNFALAAAGIVALVTAGCREPPHEAARQLPALGAKVDETSVSGISSGAYMAGQFQMAHAKRVTGAAIIAGGPYGCSESIFANTIPGAGTAFLNLSKAVNGCMLDMLGSWGVADPADLAQKAQQRAEKGEIDPIADVARDRIYLFTGTSDHTVAPSIVKHAEEFYAKLGVPEGNMKLVSTVPAGHAFVTDGEGSACDVSGQPYVVDIAFHGCSQNRETVGDAFIKESGFARWADTNRLIILFPQIAASPINPQGCWDWWGYTGPKYLTRDAPQIAAVNRMLDTLQGDGRGA
jgi:poly(3-hydroxybutyrate) depolymerase